MIDVEYYLDRSIPREWREVIGILIAFLVEKLEGWAPESSLDVHGAATDEVVTLGLVLNYGRAYGHDFLVLPEYLSFTDDQLRRVGRYWALNFTADLDREFMTWSRERKALKAQQRKKKRPDFDF